MMTKHIGFFLEQAYGHIVPTLAMTMELLKHGHRVSYAVKPSFAPLIRRAGADAVVFRPLETRRQICEYAGRPDGTFALDKQGAGFFALWAKLKHERTQHSANQLSRLYASDIPDVVIHDDCLDSAGRQLAVRWCVPRIRHEPMMLTKRRLLDFADDETVLVSVPKFFNEDTELFDDRFKYVGFAPDGRRELSQPWSENKVGGRSILACPTTGLMPQIEFCKVIAQAFEHTSYSVVLTIPDELDDLSVIDSASIPSTYTNVTLNRQSSNLDILRNACLFIGQGGQGSTLESLYCGVPALVIPATAGHDAVAKRVARLGLGARMPMSEMSPSKVRQSAETLIDDSATAARVKEAQRSMRGDPGARFAAEVIEERLLA